MKYLGIDYGKRKIGLAKSEGNLASPLKVVEISSLKDALNKVSQVVVREGSEKIIVGLSESGESRKITKAFIQELAKTLKGVEIVEVAETLSSSQAQSEMVRLGVGKNKRQQEDAFSAAIILQNFLDQ